MTTSPNTPQHAPIILVFHDIRNGYEQIFERHVDLGYVIPDKGDLYSVPDVGLILRVHGRLFVDTAAGGTIVAMFVESVTQGAPGPDLAHFRGWQDWMRSRMG